MYRFSRQLKSKVSFQNAEIKTFAICCYSLLLNCVDLSAFNTILHIFRVFLSNNKNHDFYDNREILQSLIETRPKLNDKEAIRGSINLSKFNKNPDLLEHHEGI